MFKLSELASSILSKKKIAEDIDVTGHPPNNRQEKLISDIRETWQDPREVQTDVSKYLMSLYQDRTQDYQIEDIINAIEGGIREFRKITNV